MLSATSACLALLLSAPLLCQEEVGWGGRGKGQEEDRRKQSKVQAAFEEQVREKGSRAEDGGKQKEGDGGMAGGAGRDSWGQGWRD